MKNPPVREGSTREEVDVILDANIVESPSRVGTLFHASVRGTSTFSFRYDEDWLRRPDAFSIDPDLQLYGGETYPSGAAGAFRIFLDSAPDRWGRVLLDRREALRARTEKRQPRTLSEWDYLLGVHDTCRLGALRFRRDDDSPFLDNDDHQAAPPLASLRELEAASLALEDPEAAESPQFPQWLLALLAPGSSLGGSRPKANFTDVGGALWIAKFPSRQDRYDMGAWEMVVHLLACEAGIQMAEAKLLSLGEPYRTFACRRFDRTAGGRRRFFVSANYDFPVGPVIDNFSRNFDPGSNFQPLKVDFLLARSDRKLEGLGADRDARENGLLIVDDLDAAYDLTFVDTDYEKAEFLKHIFGVVRINGLRAVLDAHLNSIDFPTSPLRVDRDGFNRDHEFSKALFDFLAKELKPCYERERKRIEEQEKDKFSSETRKRIDEALKHLNKFFQEITEKAGAGSGAGDEKPKPPTEPVMFFPGSIKLITNHPRKVLLLVRDDVVNDGCEIVATASDGLTVQPEVEKIYRKLSQRWSSHPNFFCFAFTVSSSAVGVNGTVSVLVDTVEGNPIEAKLQIEDTLEEQAIVPPTTMEFRPETSLGRPNRRNNMFLLVNPNAITTGHYIRFSIAKRMGGVELLDEAGGGIQQFDVKLDNARHSVKGQNVLRVALPWRGTGWNQHASVEARTKVGAEIIFARGHIRLDEPDPNDGGFFQRVEYDELDDRAPSKFAAGVITINTLDPLNRIIFGTGPTKEDAKKEFDRRLSENREAQQRLASILLEEASFRALQQLYDDNKLDFASRREIAEIHGEIDKYKFSSAVTVYKALVK